MDSATGPPDHSKYIARVHSSRIHSQGFSECSDAIPDQIVQELGLVLYQEVLLSVLCSCSNYASKAVPLIYQIGYTPPRP